MDSHLPIIALDYWKTSEVSTADSQLLLESTFFVMLIFSLIHTPYLNSLPTAEKLRTPLHFTASELAIFQGSNLYGATIDREKELKKEWENCQKVVAEGDSIWGKEYTWLYALLSSNVLSCLFSGKNI